MNLPTLDPLLLDWLEEFRNINISLEPETPRRAAEQKRPAEEASVCTPKLVNLLGAANVYAVYSFPELT